MLSSATSSALCWTYHMIYHVSCLFSAGTYLLEGRYNISFLVFQMGYIHWSHTKRRSEFIRLSRCFEPASLMVSLRFVIMVYPLCRYSKLHDCLHGFLVGRGTGMVTLEVKLSQQLAFLEQKPLNEVCIALRKAYDAMDKIAASRFSGAMGLDLTSSACSPIFWRQRIWSASQDEV